MAAFASQKLIDQIAFHINDIMEYVRQHLIETFQIQGHTLTGELENSMRIEIIKLVDGATGIIWVNDYYKFVDQPTPAERIPYQPGSGRKHSKFIDGLIYYFMRRLGLVKERAKGMAFATANTMKSEGKPTKGSYAFTRNGRRTGFFTNTIQGAQAMITQGVEDLFGEAMENVLNELNARLIGEITIEL